MSGEARILVYIVVTFLGLLGLWACCDWLAWKR